MSWGGRRPERFAVLEANLRFSCDGVSSFEQRMLELRAKAIL
jgi:hypothetical protein